MQRRDWEQGIFAQAMLESGQREKLIQLTRAAMVQQTADGRMAVVVSGGPTDPAMGGAAYAQAANWTGEPAMQGAVDRMLEWILHKAPRNADGLLYHTFEAPQMWSDGINGAPPFLAAMGHIGEALKQIDGYKKLLFNPQKKLMAHIWDDGKKQLVDAGFWGGGNGWTAAGLARVIRSLPANRAGAPIETWSIPANVPHEVHVGPEGAVVIDVFVPPRDDWRDAEQVDARPPRWP